MPSKQALTLLEGLFPHGHPAFIPMCIEEMELHSQKNADYARNGDPLGNFYRVSDTLRSYSIDLSPAQVAFVYMMKQVDAVGRMLGQEYEGEVEGTKGRLQDISVYAKLVTILRKEEV